MAAEASAFQAARDDFSEDVRIAHGVIAQHRKRQLMFFSRCQLIGCHVRPASIPLPASSRLRYQVADRSAADRDGYLKAAADVRRDIDACAT